MFKFITFVTVASYGSSIEHVHATNATLSGFHRDEGTEGRRDGGGRGNGERRHEGNVEQRMPNAACECGSGQAWQGQGELHPWRLCGRVGSKAMLHPSVV